MSPAWRIVPFNLEESFHWLVTYICSSIGLFMSVREFTFRRYLSLTCHSSAHRHCNRLWWSKPSMCTTIPQCGNAPQRRSAGQTGFVVLLGGCLSSDLLRTNKHREIERGGAIAQEIYFYQTDDVAEYVLLMKTLPDLCVFFFYCGIVSLL